MTRGLGSGSLHSGPIIAPHGDRPLAGHSYLGSRPRPAGPARTPCRRPPLPGAPPPRLPRHPEGRRRAHLRRKARVRGLDARKPCRRGGRPGAVPRAGHVRPRPGSPRIHAQCGARGDRSPRLVRDAAEGARKPSEPAQSAVVCGLVWHRRPGGADGATGPASALSPRPNARSRVT